MIDAAARLGRLDRDAIMLESLCCLKRAGADIMISYFAKRVAMLLNGRTLNIAAERGEHQPLEPEYAL